MHHDESATPIAYGPQLKEPFSLRILQSSCQPIDRGWDVKRVRSSFWRLYHNTCSGASLRLDGGRRYPLTPDRVHLVPAWCGFDCHNTRAVSHLYLHFDWLGVPSARLGEVFTHPVGLTMTPALRNLVTCVRRGLTAVGDSQPGPHVYAQAKALAYTAVGQLLAESAPAARAAVAQPADDGGAVAAALEAIEAEPGARLGNPALAAMCHLSVDHFIRRFREEVGQTPARYAEQRRVARAAERLAFTPDTIEQIAASLGYPDRFSFSRAFARQMGLPPGQYRRQPMV